MPLQAGIHDAEKENAFFYTNFLECSHYICNNAIQYHTVDYYFKMHKKRNGSAKAQEA